MEFSIHNIMELIDQLPQRGNDININFDMNRYIDAYANMEDALLYDPVGVFILDFRNKICNDTWLDINSTLGIPFGQTHLIKEDLNIFSSIVFTKTKKFNFLKNDLKKFWYSINYRLKDFNSQIIHILQYSTIVEVDDYHLYIFLNKIFYLQTLYW